MIDTLVLMAELFLLLLALLALVRKERNGSRGLHGLFAYKMNNKPIREEKSRGA